MMAYFVGPRSFTGEDMLEIYCHGSLLIVNQILEEAIRSNMRLAKPGEFSRRAFANNKMSAEKLEAINAVVFAKSEKDKENALKIIEGKSSLKFKGLQSEIVGLFATLQNAIEYPGEDIPEEDFEKKIFYEKTTKKIQKIITNLERMAINYDRGKVLSKGVKVVLFGKTNAGKSTLLNALLQEKRAIVSEMHGSTRDYIREEMSINGNIFAIFDTAGIRDLATKTSLASEKLENDANVSGGAFSHGAFSIKDNGQEEGIAQTEKEETVYQKQVATEGTKPNQTKNNAHLSIEKEGIGLAIDLVGEAHIVIGLISNLQEAKQIPRILHSVVRTAKVIWLINKVDLYQKDEIEKIKELLYDTVIKINADKKKSEVSGNKRDERSLSKANGWTDWQENFGKVIEGQLKDPKSKEGEMTISKIEAALLEYIKREEPDSMDVFLVSKRQKKIVENVLEKMKRMVRLLDENVEEEILSEEFKPLVPLFEELNLDVRDEKIFDEMFKHFCLGK